MPRPRGFRYSAIAWALWLGGWVLISWSFRESIRDFRFGDPDDLLRLQQVRDFLAGQSWFDVAQYRLNLPDGVPMHWSRLLDLPLAAVILMVQPLAGAAVAERAAAVLVPLATYGCIFWLMLRWTAVLLGRRVALAAGALLTISPAVLAAVRPMRIDHHGWQLVCGLAITYLLTGRRSIGAAALAGIAAAFWAHISLEALPFAAAAAALLGLRWALAPAEEGGRLTAFLGALSAGSLAFFLVAHGAALFDRNFCDAVSPIHLLLFGLAAAAVAGLRHFAPPGFPLRLAALVGIAVAGALLYRVPTPQCAGGPFAQLDPLTYRLWYLKVMEGLPIWHQAAPDIAFVIGFPLLGLAGCVVAWSRATGDARRRWEDVGLLLAASIAIAAMVMRAGALANLLALPGGLALMGVILVGIGRWRWMPARVLASAAAILLLVPPIPMIFAGLARNPDRPEHTRLRAAKARMDRCYDVANFARLGLLPDTTILTPLNIAPAVLVATPHRLVASGHHRGAAAMLDVMRVFTGSESQAQAIIRRRQMRFLMFCPDESEMTYYAKFSPNGFAARLLQGHPPAWVTPLRIPGMHDTRVYRIVSWAQSPRSR